MSGFDWSHFARNFLKGFAIQTTKQIEESTDAARDYERRQRDLAERNLATISRRNAVANQVLSLTRQLRDEGASQAQIQAAIAAGPKVVAEFASKVSATKELLGGRKLNQSEMETVLAVPDDFTVVDTGMEDLVRNTYGLGYVNKGVTDKIPKLSLMDVITGRRAMDLADYRLDSQLMSEGYTAYDINRMAAKQDYESVAPGTFVTFGDVKYFGANDYTTTYNTAADLVEKIQETTAYQSLASDKKDLEMLSSDDVKARGGQAKVNSEIARLEAEMDALLEDSTKTYIDRLITEYGESFTLEAGPTMLRTLGFSEEYIRKRFGLIDESAEGEGDESAEGEDDLISSLRPRARPEDLTLEVLKEKGQPAVDTAEEGEETQKADPEAKEAEVLTEERDTKEIPFDTVDPNGITYADAVIMSSEERKEKGLPSSVLGLQLYFEKYLTMENEDVTIERTTSASDTAAQNEANQSALRNAMGDYTFAEWSDMSRKERKEKGLPERRLDVAFAGKDAFKPEPEPEDVPSMQDRFAETYNISRDQLELLLDQGKIHPLDVQIVTQEDKDGNLLIDQLVDYVKGTGYDLSNSNNIFRAISEWSDETNIRTPMNLNFLIGLIRQQI